MEVNDINILEEYSYNTKKEELKNMQIIKPYANNNAVKVVAFAINFLSGFSQQEINSLIEVLMNASYFNDNFNNSQKSQEMSLTIHADGTQAHEQSVGGIVYENIGEANPNLGWSLTINKNFILVTCRVYTRWDEVSLKAIGFITHIFNMIDKNKEIAQITLEYLDEFEILATGSNWKEKLFKQDCKYILSHINDLSDFWHINHGYFIKLENLEQKLLDTLNINYFADEQDNLKQKINIASQHVLLEMNQAYNEENIKEKFNIIHQHSKRIFEEIVHADILAGFDRGIKE